MNPGTIVDGKYRVDRQLGEGGMATVFAATHVHLNERVALKVLLASLAGNPTVVERFMREARAAARLKSEHVVRVMDVGTLPSHQPYIVMELLDGTDLEVMLKERGKVPAGEVVDYILQVCEALAEAHVAGIVHRDIKPANCVLASRHDGTTRIKVLDFGIAKLTLGDAGPQLTATQATMGTPAFMSPEQIRGAKDVDHRGDIWSLGVALFQLLVGKVPFMADTYGRLVMAVMREPTPQIPDAPPGLVAVVEKCLAKDREHRYQTVGELAAALEPFAGDPGLARTLVQRCVALARNQQAIMPATTGIAPQPQSLPQPLHMSTPAHGSYPMTTPAHGSYPMTAPAHGSYPMTTPAHGSSPMPTPAHGMQPVHGATPPHGLPPAMTTGPGPTPLAAPVTAAPAGKSGMVLFIVLGVALVALAVAAALFAG